MTCNNSVSKAAHKFTRVSNSQTHNFSYDAVGFSVITDMINENSGRHVDERKLDKIIKNE